MINLQDYNIGNTFKARCGRVVKFVKITNSDCERYKYIFESAGHRFSTDVYGNMFYSIKSTMDIVEAIDKPDPIDLEVRATILL